MVEKREAARTTAEHEFVLSYDDIVDMMEDPTVGLDPTSGQEFYLFIRKPNGSEINLNLRPMYEDDKIVFRFYKVVDTSVDQTFTDVDVT